MSESWILSHTGSCLCFLLHSGVFLKVGTMSKRWMLDHCDGDLPTYYFFFLILAKLEGIALKHYVIFCGIYFSRCLMYLYSSLVTFTQPPIYLFSPFHCRQSCLTGLSGEYNLPWSNAFEGFSPFFLHHPPPCHACTWNVTLSVS